MNERDEMTIQQSIDQRWTTRLGEVLAELYREPPAIRQVVAEKRQTALNEDEPAGNMLWWRASGAPAVCIGVSETDAESLLQMRASALPGEKPESARAGFSDILNRSWGRGTSPLRTRPISQAARSTG